LYAQAGSYRDPLKNIDQQLTGGLGYGYQFKENAGRKILIEAGLNYVRENFITSLDRDYEAFRWDFSLNLEAFEQRGDYDAKRGLDKLAIQDYTSAISISPNDAEVYNSRGDLYLKLKIKNKACIDFRKACNFGECGNVAKHCE